MQFSWAVRVLIALGLVLVPALAFAQWDDGWDSRKYRSEVEALGTTIVTNLPIPVLVGVELSNLQQNFGESRGGGTRTHEGLDIISPKGTPIASPTDAVITSTGDGTDSGLYIRTANPGGETFVYMHLSKIADGITSGVVVKRGEVIGFVGNTGNASGGGAHLHFEIRKDGAQNPYPRLTSTFTAEEREKGLLQAVERGGSAVASVTTSAPVTNTSATPATNTSLAKSTIAFGETNNDIFTLQNFLITSGAGPASAKLKGNGATGYFGPLTQEALREYQGSAGLTVTGTVDSPTYAKIFVNATASAAPTETTPAPDTTAPATAVSSQTTFARNLEVGMEGDDVKELQKFLNANGFDVAANGAGSAGNETTMFGGLTRAALAAYQKANSITPAVGYFGPITRAHVQQKLAAR
ncbi:MAG: peptidoglycan-binding protein [Candidatus Pacebacteria bacterium]|nr:peptidoglycan-binding protein [Candidatus Paceibacterota bacterium]